MVSKRSHGRTIVKNAPAPSRFFQLALYCGSLRRHVLDVDLRYCLKMTMISELSFLLIPVLRLEATRVYDFFRDLIGRCFRCNQPHRIFVPIGIRVGLAQPEANQKPGALRIRPAPPLLLRPRRINSRDRPRDLGGRPCPLSSCSRNAALCEPARARSLT